MRLVKVKLGSARYATPFALRYLAREIENRDLAEIGLSELGQALVIEGSLLNMSHALIEAGLELKPGAQQ